MLTITTIHEPAGDLGYLLHKHPQKFQTFDLAFGAAHVFYPEVSDQRCTAALMLELDTVRLTRRGDQKVPQNSTLLKDYINDRPYAAGSQLSQALNRVFRTAMSGRCNERPELAAAEIPLEARVESIRMPRGEGLIRALFEPLGYEVTVETPPMDPEFPGWGEGIHHNMTLKSEGVTLSRLLNHLYVLLPVLDNDKHYFVSDDEVGKLLQHGEGWLAGHPMESLIHNRYLGYRRTLVERAESESAAAEAARAAEAPETEPSETEVDETETEAVENSVEAAAENAEAENLETGEGDRKPPDEVELEKRIRLGDLRIEAVLEEVRRSGAESVLDAGSGEGHLMARLADEPSVKRVTGLEVRQYAIRRCWRRLNDRQKAKCSTLHGSLTYADPRLAGHDAAVTMEVVEHIDPERLDAFAAALFGIAAPVTVIMTTPNVEYNATFTDFRGPFRHRDHRFEWTRAEFREWAEPVAARHGYEVRFEGIGEEHPDHGHPTQMAVFTKAGGEPQ